jgi:pyruvate formate lyase activating enzyme
MSKIEASYYQKLPGRAVQCNLCEHRCQIEIGETGFCRTRQNENGTLMALNYGINTLEGPAPVESQHLYHFQPGSSTYMVSTPGCNFRCWWCAETQLVSVLPKSSASRQASTSPETLVGRAVEGGCSSIAYTTTEPTVFFEYALDTARLAYWAGLANLFITNGYITPEALSEILPYLDAALVDLKTFRQRIFFGNRVVRLEAILDNLIAMKRAGIWVEVSTLLISGVNEEQAVFKEVAAFIADELGPETPWHINRLQPRMNASRLSGETRRMLNQARETGYQEGLQHVYIERISGKYDTDCSLCGQKLIRRAAGQVELLLEEDGSCPHCGHRLEGVFPQSQPDFMPSVPLLAASTP